MEYVQLKSNSICTLTATGDATDKRIKTHAVEKVCANDGCTRDAVLFCENCRTMLCGECDGVHERASFLKTHVRVYVHHMDFGSSSVPSPGRDGVSVMIRPQLIDDSDDVSLVP